MLVFKVNVILVALIHVSIPITGTKVIDVEEDYPEDELQYVYQVPSRQRRETGGGSIRSSATVDCSFTLDSDEVVDSCNITLSSAQHNVSSWRTGTPSSAYWLGGPATDATTGGGGGYAFATMSDILHSSSPTSEPLRRREAWLKMPRTKQTQPTGRCLSFQYAVDGLSVDRLEVFLMSYMNEEEDPHDNSTEPIIDETKYGITSLWNNTDTTQGEWKQASLTFTAMSEHSIIFKTQPNMKYASMKYNGYAAVDDISFIEGPCENECMFDADFCSWNNTEDDDFDWQLGRSSDQRGTGPSRDHASSLNEDILTGGYAYIPSGYPRRPGDSARLQSKEMESGGQPICLSFWINLHGGGIGELRVLKIEDNNASDAGTIIWQQKGSDTGSDFWNPCQLTVSSDSSYRVMFEAIVGIPGAGDIALDTVTFTNKPCPSLPNRASSGWGDCTFHQDTCSWRVYNPKDAMLARVPGRDTYDPPGHTTNFWSFDHYMKWDLSNYQYKALEKSLLISPEIPESDEAICLSFWVYMYSTVATNTKLGALAVVLQYRTRNVTIWRLQNYQHSGWTYAQVPLDSTDSPRVVFEGIKGPTVIGKILLDDIAIFSSTCTTEPSVASVETGDCTFDNEEMCGWLIDFTNSDSTDGVKNWRFADKYVIVVEDNTFNTKEGGYMLIESLNVDLRSILLSPSLSANSSLCMTFWYTAYYPDSGASLELYRRSSSSDQVLWSITQADLPAAPESDSNIVSWNFGQVVLSTQDIEFKVYFQAKLRNSGWALDDIRYLRDTDSCSTRPASAA